MLYYLNTGDTFKLTDDAIENYGEKYRDIVFRIISWADRDLPCSIEQWKQDPSKYTHCHPGFDKLSARPGERLYDADPIDTDLEFNNSVYDWEVEPV